MTFKVNDELELKDFLINNISKWPRVIIKYNSEKLVHNMYIYMNSSVLQSFDANESFVDVLLILFSYYFINKIQYPEIYQKILGIYDEMLNLTEIIVYEKKENVFHVKLLDQIKKNNFLKNNFG